MLNKFMLHAHAEGGNGGGGRRGGGSNTEPLGPGRMTVRGTRAFRAARNNMNNATTERGRRAAQRQMQNIASREWARIRRQAGGR